MSIELCGSTQPVAGCIFDIMSPAHLDVYLLLVDIAALLACFYLGYRYPLFPGSTYGRATRDDLNDRDQAWILKSSVTHARLIPTTARHTFTYPVLSFLLPLSALESGRLSLGRGYIFSYGGISCRLLGIRASAYLFHDRGEENSIRQKLCRAMNEFGLDGNHLDDAWMMTMPSYMGWEGINPLTVYFCYKLVGGDYPHSRLWVIVLEVCSCVFPFTRTLLNNKRSTTPSASAMSTF